MSESPERALQADLFMGALFLVFAFSMLLTGERHLKALRTQISNERQRRKDAERQVGKSRGEMDGALETIHELQHRISRLEQPEQPGT